MAKIPSNRFVLKSNFRTSPSPGAAPAEDVIGTFQLILELFIIKQILKRIEHKNAQSVVNGYQDLSQKQQCIFKKFQRSSKVRSA
jgi:hypothetical protein